MKNKRKRIQPELTSFGSWKVRWTEGGRRRSQSFSAKAAASAFCRDLERGDRQETSTPLKKSSALRVTTFRDLAEKYWTNHVLINTRPNTQRKYEMMLRNYIYPGLGSLPVAEMHLTDLDDFAAKLAIMKRQKGRCNRAASTRRRGEQSDAVKISPKWQRDVLCLALSIAKYGHEREYLNVNPFRRFKLQKLPESQIEYLTGEEVERFLAWCDEGGPYQAKARGYFPKGASRPKVVAYTENIARDAEIFRYALHTGSRLGEVLGLKRKAIDFENRLIWISEIYDSSAAELAKRTKGKNVRCVEMDEVTLAILERRRDLAPEELVFGNIGHPLWMSRFYMYCNRAGIKHVSFHCFRHTFASTMALYTPPAVLQKLMGHESWETTRRYVHIARSNVIGFTKHLEGMYKKHRDIEDLAALTLKLAG